MLFLLELIGLRSRSTSDKEIVQERLPTQDKLYNWKEVQTVLSKIAPSWPNPPVKSASCIAEDIINFRNRYDCQTH
jgi:hypothetical protein